MPKRSRSSQQPSQGQHLYLLVEDWERGCSIYRVGEDDFRADWDDYIETRPLTHIEARHPVSWSFATHGTKIMAVRPREGSPVISGFDTQTMGVTVCPLSCNHSSMLKPFYASVGDKLFVMVYPVFEALGSEPPPDSKEPWSWSWIRRGVPFLSEDVTGSALHPDGCTLFVSVKGLKVDDDGEFYDGHQGTYSFNTALLEFRYLGEWMLPFKGQGHYDSKLDAWIGLCKEGTGYVCSCDIPSVANCETRPQCKVSKDMLFDQKSMRHRGATLVNMGGSKYCLVQCCAQKDDQQYAYPCHRVMKMFTFDLKYDKKAELWITHHQGRAYIFYKVDGERVDPTLDPIAFWL